MSDGAIGKQHVTIPDLIEPVVAFRTMKYCPPTRIVRTDSVEWREPNAYRLDKYGTLVPDESARENAYRRMMAEHSLKKHKVLVTWQPALKSPNRDYVWDRENTALCDRMKLGGINHQAPEAACECGLYCYYEPNLSLGNNIIYAIVTVSGKIEAHKTGMRAQHMTVEHLFGTEPAVQDIADKWKVPYGRVESGTVLGSMVVNDVLATIASEYGSPMPDSMKPTNMPF